MDTPGPGASGPALTGSQREAVEQLTMLTGQSEDDAIALLQRSQWSVNVAVSKFFDGEEPTPDLDQIIRDNPNPVPRHVEAFGPPPTTGPPRVVDLGDPVGGLEPTPRSIHDIFQQAIYQAEENNRRVAAAAARSERTELARRIVVPPPAPIVRPSFPLAVLLAPFHLGYRLLAGLWRAVQYVLGLLPASLGLRRVRALHPRRQLSPRDSAARFKREFEEAYGSKSLPFADTGYAQAFDKAKADPKFLVVVLLSAEHDDHRDFCRDTLLHPDVVEYLNSPASNILLWGGDVRDTEAYQVSLEYRVTKLPFVAVVCVTPKEGGSTRMGTVKRALGKITADEFLTVLRSAAEKHADDLAAVRAVRVANEASRNIRMEQDDAYERSLARDRERARQRQEAERRAREKQEDEARQKRLAKQWRAWRAANLAPEPQPGTAAANVVRVALKLPESLGGERLRRTFAADATVEDLYAIVECQLIKHGDSDEDDEGGDAGASAVREKVAKPEGYTHSYQFRIASMMPRELHEPSETTTLLAAIGKAASLVVEELEESEAGDDDAAEGPSGAVAN